jgi:hypothetical protein
MIGSKDGFLQTYGFGLELDCFVVETLLAVDGCPECQRGRVIERAVLIEEGD